MVDFGCGGGIDVILSSHKVGAEGRVIGIDGAAQMIERARRTVAEAGLEGRNIELHVGDLANAGFPGEFADVVISNCVINLVPDKDSVYAEAFRILRPGGRIAISDIVFTEDIVPELLASFRSTWSGCVGGAVSQEDYWKLIGQVGFEGLQTVSLHVLTPEELEAMACCPGEEFVPPPSKGDLALVEGKVASVKFTARKPTTA